MNDFTDFTEKDYQSYINLLRLAFDAVLNAETLEDAKRKAAWASVGQIHSGYGAFEIVQAQKQIDELTDSLAESQRREELLRPVAEAVNNTNAWGDLTCGDYLIGCLLSNLNKAMLDKALQAAINGGALASQWQQTTDKILDERHELWQQMADSAAVAVEAQLPNSLLDLIRFMCNVWHKTNDWAINKVGIDILMSYPMVQGTANQMALRKIAMQPYNTENIREAVDWMIAQAAVDGGAMEDSE